jgi:hypothetical protein
MKIIFRAFVILLILFPIQGLAASIKNIYTGAKSSVVLIMAYDKSNTPLGLGSGFFIEPQKIVTNFHVIEGAGRIVVKSSISGLQAEVSSIISYSKYLDLAVLQIEGKGTPLQISAQHKYSVGDKVVAIGNPRGLEGTVSEGIISATREVDDFVIYQITAPISLGSSGGPLFDEHGKVIGVTTATIADGQNLNFSIPIWLLPRLKKGGAWEPQKGKFPHEAKRGNAGIILSDFSKRNQYNGELFFTLRNENNYAVKNLVYLMIYKKLGTNQMIHFSLFVNEDLIPPGLAKRIKQFDSNMEGLSSDYSDLQGSVDAVIYAELRVLTYDIEETQKKDALSNALENLK